MAYAWVTDDNEKGTGWIGVSGTSNPLGTTIAILQYRYLQAMIEEIETNESLRQLKNRATHEPEGTVSVDEARSYVRIADKLTDLIRGLRRKLDGPGFDSRPPSARLS